MTRWRALPVVLPLLTVLAACGGGGPHVATGPTGPTGSTSTSTTAESTTTTATATTTRGPSPSTTATTAPTTTATTKGGGPAPSTTTTAPRPPVSTTAAPPTTLTTAPPSPPVTSYTHNPAVPDCAPAVIATAASTDATSYSAGANVTITVDVGNTGKVRCQFRPQGGPGRVQVDNAAGTTVWSPPYLPGVYALPPYYTLGPGQSFVSGTWTWDQHSCSQPCHGQEGGQVPAGQYKAVPTAEATGPATDATFTIR